MPRKDPAGRHFSITVNNPEGHIDFTDFPDLQFCTYMEEIGETGNHHFQMHMYFKTMKSALQVKGYFDPDQPHVELTRNVPASISYADGTYPIDKKGGQYVSGPYVFGEPPSQGKRSDLISVKRKLDDGEPMSKIADEHFGSFIRYHKSFREYKIVKKLETHRITKTQTYVMYGPPGVGKSYLANHWNNSTDIYTKDRTKWWDGYTDQKIVTVDDMDGSIFDWKTFLALMDEYPLRVETKGSTTPFVAESLIFTSNVRPDHWYHFNERMQFKAFTRRVTKWYNWTEYGKYEIYDNWDDFSKVVLLSIE